MKKVLLALAILLGSQISFGQNCTQKLTVMDELNIDGDGVNDDFFVEFACPVDSFHIIIYDRIGAKLFESKDQNFKWNCSDENNKLVDSGTLEYRLKYMSNGEEFSESGNFTINH